MSSGSGSSSSHSSESASEPPIRSRRIRQDFTEPNGDYDQPFAIPDPPYVHTWEKYPEFVGKLVRSAGVPPPHLGGAGPSSQTITTPTLPTLPYPIEQALAALMAGFDLERLETERRVERIDGTLAAYRETRTKVTKIEQDSKELWRCHNSMANGVMSIEQRQDAEIADIRAELQELKAKRAKDKQKIKALKVELDEVKKDKVAITAQLELAVQGVEALNEAMVTTQQHIEEMAVEIEALGEEQEEPEEDDNALAIQAEEPEEMDVEGQEEIIDP